METNNPNQEPIVNQYSQQLPSEQPVKQKGFLLPIIGIILFVFVVGAGAYYLGISKSSNLASINNTNTTPGISPTSVANENANWKTFNSEQGGFTVKYPSDWEAKMFEEIKYDTNRSESGFSFYSKLPQRDAVMGDYMCVDFRIRTGKWSLGMIQSKDNDVPGGYQRLQNGADLTMLDNNFKVIESKNNLEDKDYVTLNVTSDKNIYPVDLPNGKQLSVIATFNCIEGDINNIQLTYDQQLQSKDYKQAIEILKSIKF